MEEVTGFKNVAMESLKTMWLEISAIFPNIIGTLFILIIGFFIAKIVTKIIRKALTLAKVNKLDDKINQIEIIEGKSFNFNTIKVITSFVKWVIYIMLIIMASDIMGLTIISEQIGELLAYLPQLFTALLIFMLGLLFANFIKVGLISVFQSMGVAGGRIIGRIVFFLLLTFISVTALNQAGVDTEIITQNLVMIMAAFLLAFAIAFGLGAREVVSKVLRTFYARKTFHLGQKIMFNNKMYTIESVENISAILKNEEGRLVVPINDLVEKQIELKN
ncbi:mechanosensitive ion channel family protein [Winogradskyella ursingii]|uniref:mechanosensitive ion channel family protein n=1 Tax=Winogradskyella ursingii TaxID=2686079 RepID=UPI0015CD8259|nr:hypothetical protein [Winogradskyella ursingii]